MERARSITSAEASELPASLKRNPEDSESYWTLVRHYEHAVNPNDLHTLRLWLIEFHPAGKSWPGNINPRLDRSSYERGKALWLVHLAKPDAAPELYQRAADFLEGGDKPLAETVLERGAKAHPSDPR